jgi:hypothetical protein
MKIALSGAPSAFKATLPIKQEAAGEALALHGAADFVTENGRSVPAFSTICKQL